MLYRKAEENDLPEINQLFSKAVEKMISEGILQWDEIYPTVEDFSGDIGKNQAFVGVDPASGKIAVYYVLNQEFDEEYNHAKWNFNTSNFYIVHRLCVHPEFQHQGIATKTMRQIETQTLEDGMEELRLDVYSQNPYSLKLYDRAGYVKTGEANWRKGLFYLMEKRL